MQNNWIPSVLKTQQYSETHYDKFPQGHFNWQLYMSSIALQMWVFLFALFSAFILMKVSL